MAETIAHRSDNAWLAAYDPTLITDRFHNKLSYEKLDDNESQWRLETSIRWACLLQEELAMGVQLMIPTEYARTLKALNNFAESDNDYKIEFDFNYA